MRSSGKTKHPLGEVAERFFYKVSDSLAIHLLYLYKIMAKQPSFVSSQAVKNYVYRRNN